MNKFYAKHKNKILLAYTFAFFIYLLIWSILKPYNYGPDEYHRFPAYYYVFIHNYLPSGWLEEIRNPIWGFSYAFLFTWLPGLCSVLCMKISSLFFHTPSSVLIAARFPGVIMGTLCVFLIFKILDAVMEDEKTKWVVTILVTSIPQFAFISSYVNNDIFALAGTFLILYSWVIILKKKEWNVWQSFIMAGGIFIVVLSYYNAYGWILCSLIFAAYYAYKYKKYNDKFFWCQLIIVSTIAICSTAYFWIRNIIIYDGDMFGLKTMLDSCEMYAWESIKPSNRITPRSSGISLLSLAFNPAYIKTLFLSFIGLFGYMEFGLRGFVYLLYLFALATGFLFSLVGIIIKTVTDKKCNSIDNKNNNIDKNKDNNIATYRYKNRNTIINLPVYMLLFLSAFIVCALTLYNSWNNDYSPQGRYLYPALPSLVLILGIGYEYLFTLIKRVFIRIISNNDSNNNSNKNTKNISKNNELSDEKYELIFNRIKSILCVSFSVIFLSVSLYSFATVYVPSKASVGEGDPTPEQTLENLINTMNSDAGQ